MLQTVWDQDGLRPLPSAQAVRAHALTSVAELPAFAREPRDVTVPVSDALAQLITALVETKG